MQREIKFRAWHVIEKVMEYPMEEDILNPLVILLNGELRQAKEENLTELTARPLEIRSKDEIKLMQYTGLKYKNGKEVWENDIILYTASLIPLVKEVYEVVFYQGSFGFVKPSSERSCAMYLQTSKLEVIGNIYESPELLQSAII